MPSFINNGPDIPERLLQAHEDGRVVFFCGAGVSYPAKLPGFARLVKDLYSKLGVTPSSVQQAAIKDKHFDRAIGLLESDITGGREKVRRKLAEILTPDLTASNATKTHEALLTLAGTRDDQLRLVTTNFDRLFEEVIANESFDVESYKAPLLPIPKNRWDGLVYLHGLLTTPPTLDDLQHLVISSGDFGLAYLTERWASRFVGELFRNYTVCFIGYSIDDPVLRYMMDALAADRLMGENPPEMFAFGNYKRGKEKECADEWKAKSVTPILYRNHNHHAYLHKTLHAWADTYRDGASGKQMIVAKHATTPPLAPSRSDFAVGRVLWALTDELAAKYFADLNPAAPLKWIAPLTELQFEHEDLSRFGVVPERDKKEDLRFSVLDRPTPYVLANWMHVADMGGLSGGWDGVMFHLARWLTRHLNDPALIIWLVKQGGQLHERFALMVQRRLEELDQLKREGKTSILDDIRRSAPRAIPGSAMGALWRVVLSGRVKSPRRLSIYDWFDRLRRDGLTATARMELRDLLKPCVVIREPFRAFVEEDDSDSSERIADLVNWELVLATDHTHSALSSQTATVDWNAISPNLLKDFTALLVDALDLMAELDGAGEKSDLSNIAQPSVSSHGQNNDFRDWTALIRLTRDAWLATSRSDPNRARRVIDDWWVIPYPLFKRLCFFAATDSDVVTPSDAIQWLLGDDNWWLWSSMTKREAIRLLVDLAPNLTSGDMLSLEDAILQGPPRELFKEDTEKEIWEGIVERAVWLRLAKMEEAGANLGQSAKAKLDELGQQNPGWQLAADESDEFSFWMGSGDDLQEFLLTPPRRPDLVEWLKDHRDPDPWKDDDWPQRCREDFPVTAASMCDLARSDEWVPRRLGQALQVWSEDPLLRRSWRYMAQLASYAPDEVIFDIKSNLSWWLQAQARTFKGQDEVFFSLCHRVLNLDYPIRVDLDRDPVSTAINHPIGHVAEALLRWWYKQEPERGAGLPDVVKTIFTELCDTSVEKFRHGRVQLATHAAPLFSVDEDWVKEHLLPLFDWQQLEAGAVWRGFLCSPRNEKSLIAAIKQPLLDTVGHYDELGDFASQYSSFLTIIALDTGDTFSKKDMAEVMEALPPEGLQNVARTLKNTMEGAGEQRSDYWHNRVLPFLKKVWPKSIEHKNSEISEQFAELCVATDDLFPAAMAELRSWLVPVAYPDHITHVLQEKTLCETYPSDALELLDAVIEGNPQWVPRDLNSCLKAIVTGDATLVDDPRFVRLTRLTER